MTSGPHLATLPRHPFVGLADDALAHLLVGDAFFLGATGRKRQIDGEDLAHRLVERRRRPTARDRHWPACAWRPAPRSRRGACRRPFRPRRRRASARGAARRSTLRWSFITSSYLSRFLRISKLRASTFCCAFSSALLIHGWTIASPSLRPSRCSMPSSVSAPKMRIRSSSSDRKNFEWPGSPWRPERPRSWLSMRRLSWRSVPSTKRPPAASAFSLQPRHLLRIVVGAADFLARGPSVDVGELLADAHVDIAAELNVGAAAGHVGGDGDGAGHAGLGDDQGFLLVVAGVQDGEYLGLGGAVVAGIERGKGVGVGEVVRFPAGLAQHVGELLGFLDRRRCRPAPAGRAACSPRSAR